MEIQDGEELVQKLREYAKIKGYPWWVKYFWLLSIGYAVLLIYDSTVNESKSPLSQSLFFAVFYAVYILIYLVEKREYDKMISFLENARCDFDEWTEEGHIYLQLYFYVSVENRKGFSSFRQKLTDLIRETKKASYIFPFAYIASDKPHSIVDDLEDLLEEQTAKIKTSKNINAAKLKLKLSEGEIDVVLKRLFKVSDDKDFKNQISLLKQRYLEYKRQSNMGTVSFDDFMVERTRVTATLLEFIDNLDNNA